MDTPDLDERPVKKRRFFTEDAPELQLFSSPPSPATSEPSHVASSQIPDGPRTPENHTNGITKDDFDVNLLSAVVGTDLSDDVVQILRKASEGNLERGKSITK